MCCRQDLLHVIGMTLEDVPGKPEETKQNFFQQAGEREKGGHSCEQGCNKPATTRVMVACCGNLTPLPTSTQSSGSNMPSNTVSSEYGNPFRAIYVYNPIASTGRTGSADEKNPKTSPPTRFVVSEDSHAHHEFDDGDKSRESRQNSKDFGDTKPYPVNTPGIRLVPKRSSLPSTDKLPFDTQSTSSSLYSQDFNILDIVWPIPPPLKLPSHLLSNTTSAAPTVRPLKSDHLEQPTALEGECALHHPKKPAFCAAETSIDVSMPCDEFGRLIFTRRDA